jgi:hypothetical protein
MNKLIGLAILAGAGYLAWMFYKQSQGPTTADGRIVPQPSGFNYAGTPVQDPVRTRPPDAPIIGTAVPRTTPITTTTATTGAGTRGHVAPTTVTTNTAPVIGTFGYQAPDAMIAEDTGGVLAL